MSQLTYWSALKVFISSFITKWVGGISKNAAVFSLLIFSLLAFGSETFARGKIQGVATIAQNTITAGLSSSNKFQRVISNATITVYAPGTTTLLTLFSSASGVPLGNPFTASSVGSYFFYTDAASCDIRISATGITPFTISDIPVAGNQLSLDVRTFGAKCDAYATDDSTAFQAAATAARVAGSGIIFVPVGGCKIATGLIVGSTSGGGDGLGSFTGISFQGVNGLVGSTMKWYGSTSGQMIKIVRGRQVRFKDIGLASNVAKGTTIGLWLSGPPNLGEQTSGMVMENCNVNGFDHGVQAGDIGGSAAGELKFIQTKFENNNYGYYGASSGNSLVISLDTSSFYNNVICGANLGAGSGDTHVTNCGFVNNGAGLGSGGDIRVHMGWARSLVIDKSRFEEDTLGGGILNTASAGSVTLIGNNFAGNTPTNPVCQGAGFWHFIGNSFGIDSETAWKVWGTSDNQTGELIFENNLIQSTAASFWVLETATTGQVGMRYREIGTYYRISGTLSRRDDVLSGVVGTSDLVGAVIKVAHQKVVGGVFTGDVLAFGNQNATPDVAYGGGYVSYTTADTGATTQTNMLNGVAGQVVTIWFGNGNRTIQDNANQQLAGGADFIGTTNDVLVLKRIGTVWYEISRSVN